MVIRQGVEMLRSRERRHPRTPNATPHLVERRVVANEASEKLGSREATPR
jgi:hypothetical protein